MSLLLSAAPVANHALGEVAANAMAARLEGGSYPVGMQQRAGGLSADELVSYNRRATWLSTKARIGEIARGLLFVAALILAITIIAIPGISGGHLIRLSLTVLTVGVVSSIIATVLTKGRFPAPFFARP